MLNNEEAKTYNPDVLSCIANLSSDEVFTPPDLANQMLDLLPEEIWSDPNITILDPACKSGVFLREAAKRLIVGLEDEIPDLEERVEHIFKKQLFGMAITELTSLLSRRSVYCSKYPNSKYSVVQFENPEGNIDYKMLRHTWRGGKCERCGASQAEYDRDEALESYAYEFIHIEDVREVFDMKFDVIIGNPPYQLRDGGAQASAKPVYHLFVERAKKLNPRYLSMIMPARWYTGGKGLDDFREEMLNDKHIQELHDFPITDDCFPGVNIRGGVCYFLWNSDYDNSFNGVKFVTHDGDTEKATIRPLSYKGVDILIRHKNAIAILEKVMNSSSEWMSKLVSARKPFGLETSFVDSAGFHDSNKGLKEPVICIGRGLKEGYAEKADLSAHLEWLDGWKLFAPRANNIGTELADDNLNSFVVGSNTCCTESYIVIGADENYSKEECENLSNYLHTKFARFMHSVAKVSQDATSKTYRFVPVVDFTEPWTDEKLYNKFGLTDDEKEFIETSMQPMESEA